MERKGCRAGSLYGVKDKEANIVHVPMHEYPDSNLAIGITPGDSEQFFYGLY